MMKYVLIVALLLPAGIVMSQELNIPDRFEPKVAADYQKYEKEVVNCIDWLIHSPYSAGGSQTRQAANAFLLQWLSGSPNVHIELREHVMGMVERNPDLLAIYMGGWTRYALEEGAEIPVVNGHIKGMEAVVAFYNKNKGQLKKDKTIEKLTKLNDKGKMEDYLRKNWG